MPEWMLTYSIEIGLIRYNSITFAGTFGYAHTHISRIIKCTVCAPHHFILLDVFFGTTSVIICDKG